MLKLWKLSPSHEELFMHRYHRLLGWALQLTDHDQALAEDLLHDAFIQFTFTRPELGAIRNLDNYLYGLLRNLHLSQVRWAARHPLLSLSIIEYDSAEAGLRAIDPREQIQAQDQLRKVCHYACVRKETTTAAAILILRFFQGYYTGEIAEILRSNFKSVSKRLRLARAEAKLSLENPQALGFMGESPLPAAAPPGYARKTEDFLAELRQAIFQSRRGECLSAPSIERLLIPSQETPAESVACEPLAHIVSCEQCLEGVNKRLGLPPLSERYPTDMLGPDRRSKGGPKGWPPGGPGGGAASGSMTRGRRRAREVFEHEPQELCIVINGYVQSSQRISSDLSELTLIIDLAEPISFVEVRSEQGLRLLFLNVAELPPGGPIRQAARVELSAGRTLELSLKFSNPWPALQLSYHDPTFNEAAPPDTEAKAREATALSHKQSPIARDPLPLTIDHRSRTRKLVFLMAQLWRRLSNPKFWLRPGAVTALASLLLIAAILFMRPPAPPVSAAALLLRSSAAEESAISSPDQIVHRTFTLEERLVDCGLRIADCGRKSSAPAGQLIARRRIEVWQSAPPVEGGIKARRLYDDQNRLIAGEWAKADGSRTVYRSQKAEGSRQKAAEKWQPAIRNPQFAIRNLQVWQWEPSAKDFIALTEGAAGSTVEVRPAEYVINYQAGDQGRGAGVQGVLRARVVLSRSDLHATDLALLMQVDGDNPQSAIRNPQLIEFRFTESDFERRPKNAVTERVFEPEPELLRSSGTARQPGDAAMVAPSSALPVAPSPVTASAELEVEAMHLLSQARADLGEQVSVTRTPDRALHVEAVVETDKRKQELLQALGPISGNLAVRIEIRTVAEALRQMPPPRTSPAPVTVPGTIITGEALPVHTELRRYFSGRGVSGDQVDQEVRRFADRMLIRSRRALFRARALKRLAERFSLEELRALDPAARAKWLSMIREHARAFQSENRLLRQELEPIFSLAARQSEAGGEARDEIRITDDAALLYAIARLNELAVANDETIQSALTISADASAAAAIKTPPFWRSLVSAERLAAKLVSGQ